MTLTECIARNRREINALKAAQALRASNIRREPYSGSSVRRINYVGNFNITFHTDEYSGEVPFAILNISADKNNVLIWPMLINAQSTSNLTWYVRVETMDEPFVEDVAFNIQIISNMEGDLDIYG